MVQFDIEGIVGIQPSGFGDEHVSEIGVDSPAPPLVGMDKGVAESLPSNAQMVQLRLCRPKADLNVAEAFPAGELGEGHAEVLIPAGETDHLVVAVVAIDAFPKLVGGDKAHQLSKDGFPGIHAVPPQSLMAETGISGKLFSNRYMTFFA